MRKDIAFLRELLDANTNAKVTPANSSIMKELDVYKTRCDELTQVLEDFKTKMTQLADINSKKIKDLEDENNRLRRSSNENLVRTSSETNVKKVRELEDEIERLKESRPQEGNSRKIKELEEENERLRRANDSLGRMKQPSSDSNSKRVQELEDELSRTQGVSNRKIKELEDEIQSVKRAEERKNKYLNEDLENLKNSQEALKKTIRDLEDENHRLRRSTGDQGETLRLQTEVERLNGLLKQIEGKSGNLVEENGRLNGRIKELEEIAMNAKVSEDSQRRLEGALSEKEALIAQLTQENEIYKDKLVNATTKIEELNGQLRQKDDQMRSLAVELKKTNEILVKERGDKEIELKRIAEEKDEIEKEIRRLREGRIEHNLNANQESQNLKESVKKLVGEIANLNEAIRKTEQETGAIKSENQSLRDNLRGAAQEIINLKESLKNTQGESEKAAQREIIKLKVVLSEYDERMGKAKEETEAIKRKTRELAEELVHATGRLQDSENRLRMLNEENMRLKDNATLADSSIQRDVIRLKGVVQEGKDENEALKKKMRDLGEELMHAVAHEQELEGKLRMAGAGDENFRRVTQELQMAGQVNEVLKSENIKGLKNNENLQRENNDLKEKLKTLAMEIEEMTQALRMKDGNKGFYEEKLVLLAQELERWKVKSVELGKELDAVRIRLAEADASEFLKKENADLKDKLRKVLGEIEELTQVLRLKDGMIKDFEVRFQGSMNGEIIKLKGIISDYEEKIVLLTQENERLRVKNGDLNKEWEVSRKKLEEIEQNERLNKSKVSKFTR